MADTSNLSNYLKDVADAIREKKGTEEQIPAANFDTEIASIETGIDTSDATATAYDVIFPETFYSNGKKITGNIIPEYEDLVTDFLIRPSPIQSSVSRKAISGDGKIVVSYVQPNINIYVLEDEIYLLKHSFSVGSYTNVTNGLKVSCFGIDGNSEKCLIFIPHYSPYSVSLLIYSYDNGTVEAVRKTILTMNNCYDNGSAATLFEKDGTYPIYLYHSFGNRSQYNTTIRLVVPSSTGDYTTQESLGELSFGSSGYSVVNPYIPNENIYITSWTKWDNTYTTLLCRKNATGGIVKDTVSEQIIPNFLNTYAVVNGYLKGFNYNSVNGDYEYTDLGSTLNFFEDPEHLYQCKWIADNALLVYDYTLKLCYLYQVDLVTYTKTLLYTVSANIVDGCKSSIIGIINEQPSTLAALSDPVQRLVSMVRNTKRYIDTSDSTIVSEDVLSGKIAYGSSGKIMGTLEVPITTEEYDTALATTEQILGKEEIINE